MNDTRVLVLGASGMLGHKVVQVLASDSALEVHGASRSEVPRAFQGRGATYHPGLEIEPDLTSLGALLRRVAPAVIVNAAGAVKQKDLAARGGETWLLNGMLPHALALMAHEQGARLIHVSTDCVYSGNRGHYTDSDERDAADLYGRSKMVGEVDYAPHLTLRTSIIGCELAGFRSLLSWVLSHPRGARLKGFRRAIFSGLPTVALAQEIHRHVLPGTPLTGAYNVASEPITKYDLVRLLNATLDLGLDVLADDAFFCDRSLDDARYRRATGTRSPSWEVLVRALRDDIAAWPYMEHYQYSSAGKRA